MKSPVKGLISHHLVEVRGSDVNENILCVQGDASMVTWVREGEGWVGGGERMGGRRERDGWEEGDKWVGEGREMGGRRERDGWEKGGREMSVGEGRDGWERGKMGGRGKRWWEEGER